MKFVFLTLVFSIVLLGCQTPNTPFTKKDGGGSGGGGSSASEGSSSAAAPVPAFICKNPRTDLDYRLGNDLFAECSPGINLYAQQFVSATRQRISIVELDLFAFGSDATAMKVKVEIRANKTPCSRELNCAEGALLASSDWVSGSAMTFRHLIEFRLTNNPYLEAGQKYWITIVAERRDLLGNLAVYYNRLNPYPSGYTAFWDSFGNEWYGSGSSSSVWDLNMRTQTCNEN